MKQKLCTNCKHLLKETGPDPEGLDNHLLCTHPKYVSQIDGRPFNAYAVRDDHCRGRDWSQTAA